VSNDPEYDEAVKRWNKHFNNDPVADAINTRYPVLIEGTPYIGASGTWSYLQFTVSKYGSFSWMSDAILKQQGFDGADDIINAFGEKV
jgi:hypothetical protein